MTSRASSVRRPIRRLTAVILRHPRKVGGAFALVVAVALAIILLTPRRYSSEAKLFVHVGRESVSLDPTATTGQTITMNDSRESEMTSVVDLLASRSLREQVIDAVGVAAILPAAASREEDPTARADAIRQLDTWIDVSSSKNSGV